MKKFLALLLTGAMVFSLVACGSSSDTTTSTEETATEEAATEEAATEEAAEEPAAEETAAVDGSVAVFYYTYSDTYISSVRAALDAALDAAGITYQDYDSNNSQTTQTEQVQTAIAQGASLLVVNVVDTGSDDAAKNILDLAGDIPVVFFNRSVEESVVTSSDKAVFVGTNYEEAGHMQGQMIGEYLVENYDAVDLNGDGEISYVMFKGQQGNMEAEARTQYGVEDADAVLTEAGKSALAFYDSANSDKYLVDQDGAWSSAAAQNYMQTILSQYSEANGNMVELVIANNDDMALGAIAALQTGGYNNGEGTTVIPVFGVDATEAAQSSIDSGYMTGTVKQDAEGMANAICQISQNFLSGSDTFTGIDDSYLVGTWRVNIPYGLYQ